MPSRRRNFVFAWILVHALLPAGPFFASETVTYPFFGVTHIDRTETSPRPLRIHVIKIDLDDPTLRFLVTPQSGPRDTLIQTTRQFLTTQAAQIAVNAHFFTPFPDDGSGTTFLIGLAASSATNGTHGHAYAPFDRNVGSPFQDDLPALNLGADNTATLVVQAAGDVTGYATDPPVTLDNAVSGNEQLLRGGVNVAGSAVFDNTLNPRTAIGLAPGNKLVLLTVDGRQPGVSEGMTTGELADLLHSDYAVLDAINLDGGGSTTLAMADPAPRVVNVPVGVNNVPNSERSVGSNLGVFARACSVATEGSACGDDDLCNGVETCVAGVCRPATALNCDDANVCTNDSCVPATGCAHADNTAPCGDALFCNGQEVCSGGACRAGTPVSCNDGDPCTGDSCNEGTDSCDHTQCSMTVLAAGSRWLQVTPPPGLPAVALRVSSAGMSCLPRYVDATGALQATPVFRSSAQWGTVQVGDRPIVPATAYTVQAELTDGTPVGSGTTTTFAWGNADDMDDVNVFDIICVLDGFGGTFSRCTAQADDQNGGNLAHPTTIDIDDVLAVLDAFSGAPYPDATPCSGFLSESRARVRVGPRAGGARAE